MIFLWFVSPTMARNAKIPSGWGPPENLEAPNQKTRMGSFGHYLRDMQSHNTGPYYRYQNRVIKPL